MERCEHYVYNSVFPLSEWITLPVLVSLPIWAGDDCRCQNQTEIKKRIYLVKRFGKRIIVMVLLAFLTITTGSFMLPLLKLSISLFPGVAPSDLAARLLW